VRTIDTEVLVCVRGLSKRYVQKRPFSGDKFAIEALRDVNLTIRRGATLALVGESGAGKSTLVRCLALLETPTRGEIEFDRVNLLALDGEELFRAHRQIQLVFQDPTSSMNPGMTAAEIIAEPLLIQRDGTKADRRRRAIDLMEDVGLPRASADQRPPEFSGGQRQRLAIARALALQPKLLILDEAFSNLDLAMRKSLLQLLRNLQAAHGLTYLHVSHDLRMMADWADEVAVMYEGRIVEHRRTEELFTHPEHAYTRVLLDAQRWPARFAGHRAVEVPR
jgi:ABC-type glutathione transport system ATPase component